MILKKIAYIALALLILVITTGFTIDLHYCHGEVVDVSMNWNANSYCGETKACCSDAILYLKFDHDFLKTIVDFKQVINKPTLHKPDCLIFEEYQGCINSSFIKNNNKLALVKQDKCVINQVFLI